MNYFQAHAMLDAVRVGANQPTQLINQALFLTGDLSEYQFEKMDAGVRSAGMDKALQRETARDWRSGYQNVVE
jgi:hypothetical protein